MVSRVFKVYENNCDPPYNRRSRMFIFSFTVLTKMAVQYFPKNREQTRSNNQELIGRSIQGLVQRLLEQSIINSVTVDHDTLYICLIDEKLWFIFEPAVERMITEYFCIVGGPDRITFDGEEPVKYKKRWEKERKKSNHVHVSKD